MPGGEISQVLSLFFLSLPLRVCVCLCLSFSVSFISEHKAMQRKRKVRKIPIWTIPHDWGSHCLNLIGGKRREKPGIGRQALGNVWHCVCPVGSVRSLLNFPRTRGTGHSLPKVAALDIIVVKMISHCFRS